MSASCHYLIDSTPDTMIQPFWRYISKSYSLCPSLLIPAVLSMFGGGTQDLGPVSLITELQSQDSVTTIKKRRRENFS